ncbi:conserved hypothetical protein [Sphingobium sp. SYK-6]|uniref:DUF2891 domain-containing protein n=1 Tax=Sphingobium sp. (strain NBRC 103272 / SYK-6) TaxID=627192 RepID=UPI0002277DB0|nr:DUF2891 domain-containing protein [Sphingobium sp. SYK-6]BAK68356.1 conserved hypothetical protein [Sphingobium sp. SYK-6]
MTDLTPDIASRFARLTLGHLGRQYPYKMDLVMNGPEDARPPITHNPIFHGSFDWHSCVHGWWQVMRLMRLFPAMPEAAEIRARADAMLVPDKVAGEIAWFERPNGGNASRPYGWAWLLALHHELAQHDAPWAEAIEPLARNLAGRLASHLPKLTYPIRVGTHFNSSFALTLAHRWAEERDPSLRTMIEQRARDWFMEDRDCQAWEPGGDEFLSSALCEALLMSRVLPREEFARWFGAFLPRAASGQPATLFTPAFVSDRSDGKIAHLDGLNLSRAWCWRAIGARLAPHPLEAVIAPVLQAHLDASLPHVAGDYMGEHWLATYALLALGSD